MAIPPELWKLNVKSALERLADRNYQKSAWFSAEGSYSSPMELYYELINDNGFRDFINSEEIALSAQQKIRATDFANSLTSYVDRTSYVTDARRVFEDEGWNSLRSRALELLNSLFPYSARQ